MGDPIGERHQPGGEECGWPGEQADEDQGAAEEFDDGGIPGQAKRRYDTLGGREPKQLLRTMKQEDENIETELIQLAGKEIKTCLSCYKCFSNRNNYQCCSRYWWLLNLDQATIYWSYTKNY